VDLFAFVLVCSVVLAWYAVEVKEYRDERRVLTLIAETKSETVEWGCSIDERAVWQPGGPSWLRQIAGDRCLQFLDRVVELEITGEELKHASRLRHLRVLQMKGARVTNAELGLLESVPNLEALDMRYAAAVVEAEQRYAGDDYDPDAHYLVLPDLPNLRGLNLSAVNFRGEGLANLSRIEVLLLSCTEIDDAGSRGLANLTRLKHLWLDESTISDSGLEHLRHLSRLRTLSLDSTEITDEGLAALKGLTGLEYVSLTRTGVTKAGADKLRESLVNCEIYH
jgi:hypothetical protein